MNYNFANAVRAVLAQAREEAIKLQHDYVGTEHIALALLSDDDTLLLLGNLGVDPDEIRRVIAETVRRGRIAINLGELPYTSRAKKVLEFSMTAASELKDDTVRTRHLFIGLLLEAKGIAAEVLSQVGVTLDRVLNDPTTLTGPSASASRNDPSFVQSVRAQLMGRIEQQLSSQEPKTRRLNQRADRERMDREGGGLSRVRELADQLESATRAVARAYRALEEEGPPLDSARSQRAREKGPADATPEMLVGLFRPLALAGLHLGATPQELRAALEQAMRDVIEDNE